MLFSFRYWVYDKQGEKTLKTPVGMHSIRIKHPCCVSVHTLALFCMHTEVSRLVNETTLPLPAEHNSLSSSTPVSHSNGCHMAPYCPVLACHETVMSTSVKWWWEWELGQSKWGKFQPNVFFCLFMQCCSFYKLNLYFMLYIIYAKFILYEPLVHIILNNLVCFVKILLW